MSAKPLPPGCSEPDGAAEIERDLERPLDNPSLDPSQAPTFDYGIVGANVASDLRDAARRIRERLARSVIESGRDLLAIKGQLKHGQFVAWIEAECALSLRSAERMMAAAEWAKGKNDTVSHLPPTVIYALSAPSTPPEIHDAALAKIEAGARVDPKTLNDEIAEAKRKAAQAARRARLSPEERARRDRREARRKREIQKDHREWQRELDRRDQAVNELADFLSKEVADQERLFALLEAAKNNGVDLIRRRLLEAREAQ